MTPITAPPEMSDRPPMGGSFGRVWLISFCLFVLLGGAWIVATPMSAPPDEPTHIIRADALVHGQLIGSSPGAGQPKAVTAVRVPEDLTELQRLADCLGKPLVPAGCVQTVRGTQQQVTTRIYAGRYPPLYYLIVGVPSLITASPGIVYWMRLVSLIASAVFLSFSMAATWRWSASTLLLPALLIAVTPMTLYMACTVNPNGLEISVAIGLWTTLLILVLHRAADPPPLLIAGAGVCAVTLPLVRGLSPLWVVLIAVTMVGMAWARGLGGLLHRRDIQRWLVGACVSGAAAVGWIVAAGSLAQLPNRPVPPNTTRGHLVAIVVGQTGDYLQQFIGVFGALDTVSPLVTFLFWFGAAAVMMVLALSLSSRRVTTWLAVTIVLSLAVPAAFELAEARTVGLIGQGRYYLPLAVGVVLLAGASPGPQLIVGKPLRRVGVALVIMAAAGQIGAFVWTLRRYVVGLAGPLNPLARVPSGWVPPVNPLVLDALFALVAVAYGAWAVWLLTGGLPSVTDGR